VRIGKPLHRHTRGGISVERKHDTFGVHRVPTVARTV
jgi:hypothetical protein